MAYTGRKIILSDFKSTDLQDNEVLLKVLNTSLATHFQNKRDIDYLIGYYRGLQPILNKEKEVRPEINNKSVLNHAQMISRNIVGYFLGTPIQYIQSGANSKEEIDLLNRYVAYEDKCSVDKEIAEFQSICGTAFRIVFTDGVLSDEVPFEDKCLNPSTTFVVYENGISEKPLMGVTFYDIISEDGGIKGTKYYVYSEYGMWTITSKGNMKVSSLDEIQFVPYNIGGCPIIEYPNNMWRIGDWELYLDLMDSITLLENGRLDDIDQVIQSLLVIINADIDSDKYDEMREAGVVVLKNTTNAQSDIKSVSVPLDQSGLNMFSNELEQMLYAFVGIPNRNNRSGGGGDTGQAVELRDGWTDLEIVAKNKELTFKKSEKQFLKLLVHIMNTSDGTKLSLIDIDIKFTRNKNSNLLVKTQGYMNLLTTRTLSPADCLTIVDLVSDVNEYIARGEAFWGDLFANKIDPKLSDNSTEKEEMTDNKQLNKEKTENKTEK